MHKLAYAFFEERVKEKLTELGAFCDEELADYVMVMVSNRKERSSMTEDLELFLATQAEEFTDW